MDKTLRLQKRRIRVGLASLTVLLLVAVIVFLAFRPLSPERIRDSAITALEQHDTATLIRLADPEEVKRLNLTEKTVSEILYKTLWQEPPLKNASVGKLARNPVDEDVWEIKWASEPHDKKYHLAIDVLDNQTIGWKLNLSYILWGCCWRHSQGPSGMREYVTLAREAGIPGTRQQAGNYVNLEALDKMATTNGY
jgi:hypothetical protein